MDVRVGLWRKLSTEELMLLNCGVGEDSWESLGLQGDPTSPFWRSAWDFFGGNDVESEIPVLWPPHGKCWLIGKDSDAGRDWGQEEKGTTEDEMAGWHHWLDGRAAAPANSLQWCPTLCDPIDGSPWGSPVLGILQARTLEWLAISFSNAWKWKVKVRSLSRAWLLVTPWTEAYQAPPSMGFSRQEYWSGVPLPFPRWTWVWVNSRSWWWTGRPGVLRFMGSQRFGHDWATELNWTELRCPLTTNLIDLLKFTHSFKQTWQESVRKVICIFTVKKIQERKIKYLIWVHINYSHSLFRLCFSKWPV